MSRRVEPITSKLAIHNGYYKNPSEEIVDLWLQTQGFINVHNAYFWARYPERQQRAWRDIDVIGISKNVLALAQVTTNLDDKAASAALEWFSLIKHFLARNPHYDWMTHGRRSNCIVAVINKPLPGTLSRFRTELGRKHVRVIHFERVICDVSAYLDGVIEQSGIDGRVDNAVLHFWRNLKKYPDVDRKASEAEGILARRHK